MTQCFKCLEQDESEKVAIVCPDGHTRPCHVDCFRPTGEDCCPAAEAEPAKENKEVKK